MQSLTSALKDCTFNREQLYCQPDPTKECLSCCAKAAKFAAKNVVIGTGNEAELLTVESMKKRLALLKSKQRKPRSKLHSQTSIKAAVMSEKENMAPAGPCIDQVASKEMTFGGAGERSYCSLASPQYYWC
ncbi:hypothetical protein FGB62_118g023 [Gracilaria domingensis]|nr:hypothetical protein FGB62_118g023 [Gracilaria domingensis]